MNKATILVAGKRETSIPASTELRGDPMAWATTEVATAEEAIEKFHQQDFDIAILTDGLSGEEEKKLRRIFALQNPDIIIVRYDDNENSLLDSQILRALTTLREAKRPSYTLVDDALKNAGLNIIVQ